MRALLIAAILSLLSCQSVEIPDSGSRTSTLLAWIKCDGKGGFLVHMTPQALALGGADTECIVVHEMDHIAYLHETQNQYCKGRRRGEVLLISADEINHMECRAYKRQAKCLWMEGAEDSKVANVTLSAKQRYGCQWD